MTVSGAFVTYITQDSGPKGYKLIHKPTPGPESIKSRAVITGVL